MSSKNRVHRSYPKPRRISHYKRRSNGKLLEQQLDREKLYSVYEMLTVKYHYFTKINDHDMVYRIFQALYLFRKLWREEFVDWDLTKQSKEKII